MKKSIIFTILSIVFSTFLNASATSSSSQIRLDNYDKMIEDNKNKSLVHKLVAVNKFFNKITYKNDSSNWGKKDYWAKPKEFLSKGAGDCEDFALAKLYALQELGIPKEKLKLIYSKVKKDNKYHMVLAYYHDNNKEPFILDNFNQKIFTADKRDDLVYIYSFNTIMLNK